MPMLAAASNYPKWLRQLINFDGSLGAAQYGLIGLALVAVAIFLLKRERHVLLATVGAIAGVACLATASVMWFLGPEARRTAQIISDKAHHKADSGDPCRVTADCMHGLICANYKHQDRCYRPCVDGQCGGLLFCAKAKGGQRICAM